MAEYNDNQAKPADALDAPKPYVAPELHVYGPVSELTRDRYASEPVKGDYSPSVSTHSPGRAR